MKTASKRKKYDSTIPMLYSMRKEHLLPLHIQKEIPESTKSEWRYTPKESYFGYELRNGFDEAFILYEVCSENQQLKKIILSFMRAWLSLSPIITPYLLKNKDREETFLSEIQRLMITIPKTKVLKLANLSAQSYSYRINKKIICLTSGILECKKVNPKQLCSDEINKIKSLFSNSAFACWPMKSLYYEGLKNLELNIGLSTFYKYAHKLGLFRKWKPDTERNPGLKTTKPNEFLHVDTTFWKITDYQKVAITFVSDNFSKYILGHTVALKHGKVNVVSVLKKAFNTILKEHPEHIDQINLMSDGGSENTAESVKELISTTKKPSLKHLIHMKDIAYSNSAIEAINKTCKAYLRYYKPTTLEATIKIIELFIEDYNLIRPHGANNGLTPYEKYTFQNPYDFKTAIQNEKTKRFHTNKKDFCSKCS